MLLRVLTGKRAGKVVAIAGQEFLVGSGRGCDLVLADEGVAPRHAVLRVRPGVGCFIEDLGTEEGTFVSGRRIRGTVSLEGSEELCFGATYAVVAPGSARRRRLRVPVAVALVAVSGIVLVATMIGVLLPRTRGGNEGERALPVVPVEPVREEEPAGTSTSPREVAPATTAESSGTTDTSGSNAAVEVSVVREDFSNPASGWETVSDSAASAGYADGKYVVEITQPGYYVTADSGIETQSPVVFATVHNPSHSASAGFGIMCRYESEDDFLALVGGTDGTGAVLLRRGGALSVISGNGAWVASAEVPVGASAYKLRADCRGNTVTLFVDGHKIVSAPAASKPGHVGLFVAGNAELRFDDVTIADRPSP